MNCLECDKQLQGKNQRKFCSTKCANDFARGKPCEFRRQEIEQFVRDQMLDYLSSTPPAAICSVFGCGKHLTKQEALYGKKCIHHQEVNLNSARLTAG